MTLREDWAAAEASILAGRTATMTVAPGHKVTQDGKILEQASVFTIDLVNKARLQAAGDAS